MTKFVICKNPPAEISHSEIIISPPSFLQEVNDCWAYRSATGLLGVSWLRLIATEVTKWDSNFHPYRHIIPTDYQGIPFSTPEEVAAIVSKMINDRYPKITDAWIEHCVKHKPPFTKLIWFTGDFKQTNSLSSNFIDMIELSEVEEYLGKSAKKNKPASEESDIKEDELKPSKSKSIKK